MTAVGWDDLARLSMDGVSEETIAEIARRHGVLDVPDTPVVQPRPAAELGDNEPVYAQAWRDVRVSRQREDALAHPDARVWREAFTNLQDELWDGLWGHFEAGMNELHEHTEEVANQWAPTP